MLAFKTVFYHVFEFCVIINGLINRKKTCRYFSYSPIYRLSPRKPNIPFNVLLKRKFPHVIFQNNSFPEKQKLNFLFGDKTNHLIAILINFLYGDKTYLLTAILRKKNMFFFHSKLIKKATTLCIWSDVFSCAQCIICHLLKALQLCHPIE